MRSLKIVVVSVILLCVQTASAQVYIPNLAGVWVFQHHLNFGDTDLYPFSGGIEVPVILPPPKMRGDIYTWYAQVPKVGPRAYMEFRYHPQSDMLEGEIVLPFYSGVEFEFDLAGKKVSTRTELRGSIVRFVRDGREEEVLDAAIVLVPLR